MKQRLLTPGPTPVPPEVQLEISRPMVYHRSAEMRAVLREVEEGLQQLFVTRNPVIPLTCSGTGGLEAALANSVAPGGKAICLSAGRFGDRWRRICQALGVEAVNVTVPWGQAVQSAQLARALADHPDAACVCSTLSETSTGAGHDIAAFGALVERTPALLLVDAISGLGAMECRTDSWHIDVCVTGSQKALMLPPGLAFVSVSDKAVEAFERNANPRCFYFDLRKAREKLTAAETPFTPAHTLLRGLRVSLQRLLENGVEALWRRQERHGAAARAGFLALGLNIFPSQPTSALTVFLVPPGIDGLELLRRLEAEHGLRLAGGQDSLKGKIVRVGHMGDIDAFDILAAIAGVERVLLEMGHPLELGRGLAAAQRVLCAAG